MRGKAKWMAIGLAAVIFGLIVVAGFGQAVHYLWNWLMPEIFGLRTITYWQALGLLALSWLLFGGMRLFGGPHRGHSRGRYLSERWAQMTPEERAKFREGFRRRCGYDTPPEEQHS